MNHQFITSVKVTKLLSPFHGSGDKGNSLLFVLFILHRATGNLGSIPGDSGHKALDALDKIPTHHRVQSHTV